MRTYNGDRGPVDYWWCLGPTIHQRSPLYFRLDSEIISTKLIQHGSLQKEKNTIQFKVIKRALVSNILTYLLPDILHQHL